MPRKNAKDLKIIHTLVNPDTHTKLKMLAAFKQTSVQGLMEELIRDEIEKHKHIFGDK